jgi:osmotically-inducible protein OsmY
MNPCFTKPYFMLMKPCLFASIAVTLLGACSEQATAPKVVAAPALQHAPVMVASTAPVPIGTDAATSDANKALADKVKKALEGEGNLHAAAIDVTGAAGGVVTLWGTADSDDERIRAGRIAYRIVGVNTVINKLAVVKGS